MLERLVYNRLSNITNYRPISVLPTRSKMLERLVYNKLSNVINKRNILYERQFGFHAKNMTLI